MRSTGAILCTLFVSFAEVVCLFMPNIGTVSAAAESREVGSIKIIRSARSGPWSAGQTWEGGKAPSSGVKVQIREGHTVVYDVRSDQVIRSLHVHGTLTFAADRDTRLDVGLIRITPGDSTDEDGFDCNHPAKEKGGEAKADPAVSIPGFTAPCLCCDGRAALLVGTSEQPISPEHTAMIRLVYVEGMNKESCPAIVCCGGRMDFHGAAMNRTWVKLGATARAGDDLVVLEEPVTGWRAGDRVVVTGSSGTFRDTASQTEERRIKAVHGSRLTLDEPLKHSHTGEGKWRAEIANLSRNVIVQSAEPGGIRGHTMYHAHSAGSVSYAEFRHLGKRGVLGRYALHYHLCRDTMRGSSVIGASIWASENRWLTVHGTEYLVVRDCVGYQSVGHGFFLEDGTEVYNVFDRNLAVQAKEGEPLPDQMLPFDKNGGAGFWWANSHNTFTRNVAADCFGYGFRFEATPRAGFDDGGKDLWYAQSPVKSFGSPGQQFDLALPVLQPDGRRARVDVRTLPFIRFEGNTAHNIANYGLNLGQQARGIGPDKEHPFVVRDMTIWNAGRGFTVDVPHVRIDGMHISHCGYEIYQARYQGQDYRDVRLDIWGRIPVSNLEEYLAAGKAMGKPGYGENGVNRARLPGFPRGVGAGGAAYQGREAEVSVLDPIDDLPPVTVITHVRKDGDRLHVRGTTSDNGTVKRVTVNGTAARAISPDCNEWEAVLSGVNGNLLELSAHAEDETGNVENRKHKVRIVAR